MLNENFVSDMAVEVVNRSDFADITKNKNLTCGIVQRYINLLDAALAKKVGREKGVYITFDCPRNETSAELSQALEKYLSKSILELVGIIKKTEPVFVVGLGNDEVVADSLGSRVVSQIAVNRQIYGTTPVKSQCICALSAGVYGATGIKSIEVVKSLTSTIKPSAVILIDSLATSTVGRLGASYQLSTSGIAPGSGVGQNKEKIDKNALGVPVVAVGVPFVLSMRTVISKFVADYMENQGYENNEYLLRSNLIDAKLSNLIVAPKEIKFYVEFSANVIANAINLSFK
ncbi:MAG: GPR endopeptidase [Clostridia bacterium]